MALSLTGLLRPWLASMEGVDWLNFRAHGFYSMRYLRNIRLRPELLRAAVSFWDPEVHVFRFGDQELCPTVEEFRAYLGGFGSGEVIIPPVRESAYRVLVAALGLSDNAARYLVRNGHLNAMRLIETRRMIALCMCLLAAYLLVPSAGHASSALASVVVQVEARKDVIPMVLAETLIGLDKFCSGETETFGGSPLLLQVGFSLSSPFSGFSHVLILPQRSALLSKASHLFSLFPQIWQCTTWALSGSSLLVWELLLSTSPTAFSVSSV
ncbi:hypothetical protein RHMOL_Rhmol02G0184000 [Rhododendron molle]|uniref:Uncharacterized protein n=1 Tax=Rhododendron molle TaxID=49168 RepID=A0ACC0PRY4_RHOML|nr:hypothetical protein RHMOL_Rhmol02G0184000 [Rhododendron molle]